jgi:TolB-like protein/DNA-binding winged helix-turn-helix (wHTH) protein/Tfp pilus assembly protein PilF
VSTAAGSDRVIRFGIFELDVHAGELRKRGVRVPITGLPLQVLTCLAEKPGQLVTRDELRNKLWSADTFVDFDHGLRNAIARLREALGDSAETPRYIETLTRRGYRFIGHVDATAAPVASAEKQAVPLSPTVIRRRLMLLALAVFAAIAGLGIAYVRVWRWSTVLPIRSLAVLPLENLTGNPDQDYFVDGMTDELITSLAKIGSVRIISRTSSMHYKKAQETLSQIARELGVDAIIEGTVSRSGDRIRVTIQLIDARRDRHLWAQDYNRQLGDLLRLQDQIASEIAAEIRAKLTPGERVRLSNGRLVNPEAQADYLRGRALLAAAPGHLSKVASKKQYTEQDIEAAIAYFRQAIEKDPAYAQAYAGLAEAHLYLGNPVWGGHSPNETLSDAKEAATIALKLDPSLPEAHFSLAQTLEYDWNWPEAEKEYQLALKLNPNYADAHLEYGRFVQALGRNDEALTQMHYADELDPFNIGVKVTEAYITYASRQYDLALKQFENLGDDYGLLWTYREKGMYPEAIAAWERWKAGHPSQSREPYHLATLAGIYGLEGRNNEAVALIDELKETARHRYVSGFFFAQAYIGVGQSDQAITWLERAYEEHDQWMVFANSYPGLDPLRSEPRFQALLRRMNFPQ